MIKLALKLHLLPNKPMGCYSQEMHESTWMAAGDEGYM